MRLLDKLELGRGMVEKDMYSRGSIPMPLESYDTTSGIKCNGVLNGGAVGSIFLSSVKFYNPQRSIVTYNTSWTVVNHI
jgi:hypothetical protein